MNFFHALILGVIQGLTEFLPISSTAHLLIGQQLLGLPAGDAMFSFLVIVQLGTIVSLVVYFCKDLGKLAGAFFARPFSTPENRLAWFIVIATLPALIAGYLLKDAVEALFRQPLLEAAIRLFAAAILLSLAEWLGKRSRNLDAMTWLDALIVGLFQVFSVFPGASRSGTTISGGMLRGLERPAAARFAFLMSIPVMLAAGSYQMLDVVRLPDLGSFLPSIVVGTVAAAIVGWFAVKWLLNYLGRRSLYVFAIYCAVVGAMALAFYLI
jgi:undecaprenyl-diphosphatase